MRIEVSQAIPGTILLEDVNGKTGRPIITKQTVLTDELIEILRKFLIDKIDVSNQLEDGSRFVPQHSSDHIKNVKSSLYGNINESVSLYYEQFITWEKRQTVDIARLRQIFLPLFERTINLDIKELISYREILIENNFYSRQVFKSILSITLARFINFEPGEINQIGLASLLSDAGMIKYDKNTYEISNQLYKNNYDKIKHHPIYSYRLIENSPLLTKAAKIGVLQHQERIDGSGYPLKLAERDIHQIAKIIALSDEFTKALSYYSTNSNSPIKQSILYLKEQCVNKLDNEIMTILITQLIKNP